ncbi:MULTISPECIES: hypothetical protein [unclassified Breznakia]|uniref:hypothetical protein n=1 Tax=unclassified Breznakia TaxID=2623764 RepID=UPI0024755E9D|nr:MULTISPECIES: hypothetical protein [unclassified Breznakia]MDH6368184.1 hypothetical protein [Breznakia sp. PH1-1]MDH6405275.1 hypothetical protein [Breznakia sp. PF1-11]MDH6412988.1 hypothetical protein [Breznakia sp. PFB1-11]MDH6415349.1 hypothetical protein [Breznakia sp. PFB1-14]MDH6417654.1 hypothetical protein [Breznakia sp. PFB1-4]
MNKIETNILNLIYTDLYNYIIFILKIMNFDEELKSPLLLALFPNIALLLKESHKWISKVSKSKSFENLKYIEIISGIRESIKQEFEEIDSVVELHQTEFKTNTKILGKIRKDIGIAYYDGHPIVNSIWNAYNLKIINGTGSSKFTKEQIISLGEFCSSFPLAVINELNPKNNILEIASTYKDTLNLKQIILWKDFNLSIDFKPYSVDLFCIFSLLCQLNFYILIVEPNLKDTTLCFRYKYLLYYYSNQLLKRCCHSLQWKLTISTNQLMNKEFRNCMAHYGMSHYMKMRFDENIVFFGSIEKAFSLSYKDVDDLLTKYISEIRTFIIDSFKEKKLLSSVLNYR